MVQTYTTPYTILFCILNTPLIYWFPFVHMFCWFLPVQVHFPGLQRIAGRLLPIGCHQLQKKGERNNKSSHRIIFKSGKIQQPTHCTAGQGLLHDIYWICTYIYAYIYTYLYMHMKHTMCTRFAPVWCGTVASSDMTKPIDEWITAPLIGAIKTYMYICTYICICMRAYITASKTNWSFTHQSPMKCGYQLAKRSRLQVK